MVGQKFHKVKSWGRIHSHVHNPIQTSELLWVCQSAWLEKKSSRVAVASLNICTFKDLYSCASLLPPYFLSPQYRVILVAKQIIPVCNVCIINKRMHLEVLIKLRSTTLIFLSTKSVRVSYMKERSFGLLKDFCGHSWPLHTLTLCYYLRVL